MVQGEHLTALAFAQHSPLQKPFGLQMPHNGYSKLNMGEQWGGRGGEEEVRGREGALARATTQHGTWPPPWLLGKVISKSLCL